MEHRLDTELDRKDEREEPECWYCDDKGEFEIIDLDKTFGGEIVYATEPCPACKGVEE
jgi:hypothetical protein